MPDPGFDVVLVDSPPLRGAPTATDTLYLVDFAGEGPTDEPQLIESPDQSDEVFGPLDPAWSQRQAVLDAFFALGGARVYVQRVVGPAAVNASVQVPGASGNTLKWTAGNPGAWANGATGGVTLDVIQGPNGAGERVLVLKRAGKEVARSATFTDRIDALGPLGPGTVTAGTGSGLPTVAAALSATGGNDDHANAQTGDWTAAIDKIGVAYGPGQIVAPSLTTADGHVALATHGWDRNRHPLLVPPPGADDEALAALADAVIETDGGRFSALWRDYVEVPGRVVGGTRTIPWAVVQAALLSVNDQLYGNPNLEAAGKRGIAEHVQAIVDEVDDTRRSALKLAQVNTAKTVYGQARAYGARTLADLTALPHWWNIGGSRTIMAGRALVAAVDEDEVFGQLDGQGQALSLYNGALRGALAPLYDEVGALYGTSLAEALRVDTGPTVNTTATIKAGQKRARVTLKTSPSAEHVVTFLARVAIDQAV